MGLDARFVLLLLSVCFVSFCFLLQEKQVIIILLRREKNTR